MLHIESVPGRIDHDVRLTRYELGQLLGEHLIPILQWSQTGMVLDGGLVKRRSMIGRDACGRQSTHDQEEKQNAG